MMDELKSHANAHETILDEQPAGLDPSDTKKGEKAMWRGVITQALMDAGSNSKKPQMKYNRAQAIAWLSSMGEDFITVCSLADMDPIYVRRKAKEAIARGCIWKNVTEKILRPNQPKRLPYDVKRKKHINGQEKEIAEGNPIIVVFKKNRGG